MSVPATESVATAAVPSGVSLAERRDEQGARVELRAPDGVLLLEYRPEVGALRLRGSRLELEADADLALTAGRRITLRAAEGVTLRSDDASVRIAPDLVALEAETVAAAAAQLRWSAESVKVLAQSVHTEARRVVQRVGEIDTEARQIVERARESFREVEGLAQSRAGEIRLVAEDALRALGRRAFVKAREELKLRGQRIFLD